MHKLSVPRNQLLLVRVIFIACVAVLIGNTSRFAVNLLALDPATPQGGPAREALVNIHRLLQLVIDAETGERVYRMAGKPAQLEPYRLARDQYPALLDAVAVQLPSQSASLLHLRTLLATRFDHEEPSIAVSDSRLLSLVGRSALIHRIQALIDDMEGDQVRLLTSPDPRSGAFVWTTLAAGFTINALVLALLALVYAMIQSSFTPRTETKAVRASPSPSAGTLGDAIEALTASELPQAI